MEALTGASVAALAVYDMCKAASKGIVIRDVRLLKKTGGRAGVGLKKLIARPPRPAATATERYPGRRHVLPVRVFG